MDISSIFEHLHYLISGFSCLRKNLILVINFVEYFLKNLNFIEPLFMLCFSIWQQWYNSVLECSASHKSQYILSISRRKSNQLRLLGFPVKQILLVTKTSISTNILIQEATLRIKWINKIESFFNWKVHFILILLIEHITWNIYVGRLVIRRVVLEKA